DFPKKIEYKKESDSAVLVTVSDGDKKSFSYTQKKVNAAILKQEIPNPNYDEALAKKLGGDDYGMKSYFLVHLKTGPNTITDKEFINSCFKSHFENMEKMTSENKLVVAGPV